MKTRLLYLIVIISNLIFLNIEALASDSLFYKEVNLVGGYSDKNNWVGKSGELANSIGFEDYRKFSNDYGDYLTTDLQIRAGYDSIADRENIWGIQIHNAWLLYKLDYNKKLRLGHFDSAFGLEPQLDTHSSLLQTLIMKNIGFKKDWGIGLEGTLSKFDYKTALQIGSGMSIYRRDNSFLATARIGTPETENFQYGVSFLYGNVLESMGMWTWPRADLISDNAITKKRVGLDSQYLFGPYLFKGEVAYGKNDGQDVLGYLGEIDYTLPKYQNLEIELQYQSWINDTSNNSSDDSTLTFGVSYKLDQNTTLRVAFSHDIAMADQQKDDLVVVQFYFFGK